MPSPWEKPIEDVVAGFAGGALQTSRDVAYFLSASHDTLLYILYKSPDERRYAQFEIPKKSGGIRPISAPQGLLREWQNKLLPILQHLYSAHPNAHGFLHERSVVTNARGHCDQRLVLNVDLADFFPSINFGRVRGLFMAPPFNMGKSAAAIVAQICTHKNGLPQGAPTSPVLSNFIAATLDRRLTRLARANRMRYSRYADDITFSTGQPSFPVTIAAFDQDGVNPFAVRVGEALDKAIALSGFAVNAEKVHLQTRHVRQSVTGVSVNNFANVQRKRIRRLRAMFHAWDKFGLEPAAQEHFKRYRGAGKTKRPNLAGPAFRNIIYGELAYLKMVRGAEDPIFLKMAAKLINLDPNPSKFVRQMAFGADDYDIFISHAREDKETVARPILRACEARGLKAFLDEEHIAWGESFTTKINTALGAARTVLTIVSPVSVTKEWPVIEVNTALSLEISGEKQVVALMVGKPDLTKLPLIRGKDWMEWTGDPQTVAAELEQVVRGTTSHSSQYPPPLSQQSSSPSSGSVPQTGAIASEAPRSNPTGQPWDSMWSRLFGRKN